MGYRYCVCDVFTEQRFAGNPLAVLPDARGLSDVQMQQIAREFNYSETTFVLPAEAGHTRKVRIFTPFYEVPFAGHPNIGTAFALASLGELGTLDGPSEVTFEEAAGLVPVAIEVADGRPLRCELAAPQPLSVGESVPAEVVAELLSLTKSDVAPAHHPPRAASVGLPFLFAELSDVEALTRARVNPGALGALLAVDAPLALHVYARGPGAGELRARMFVVEEGYEDPATGSASCALAGLLAGLDPQPDCELRVDIQQGVEMGRPSRLYARAVKRGGRVVSTHVAGACAMVARGELELA